MKKILALVLLLLSAIAFIYKPAPGFAFEFSTAYVRLDRLKVNTSLSGTVCATPSSGGAGTEAKIEISFPSGFTISTNTGNWTTNTSNLPSGATAWPGIGSAATSVSGQGVIFASTDLTSSSLYCFNFVSSLSSTGSAGNDKTGTISTKTSAGLAIDLTTYSLSIIANDQITITASVDPQVSNLPITIESTTAGTTFPQSTTLDYKITYGSNTTSSIPLTIQAQWGQGTISGNPSPSVDMLDYVIGSASNAYSSTAPVIDTVNRTITWTISSFPGATTGQTVTFSFKTNSSYTGGGTVSFSVLARSTSGSTVTADQTVTQNYLYSAPAATPTPTPTATTTTTTTTATTPTPTPAPAALSFSDVSVRSLSQSEAQIYVETNNKSTFAINYGTSPNSLSQTIKTASLKTQELITLPGLETDTSYYFRITAKDDTGNIVKSDIFTFRTSRTSDILKADTQSVVVISNNNILVKPAAKAEIINKQSKNIIVIPVSTVFTVRFSLAKNVPLKVAQLIVRNKKVLGFSTIDKADASSDYVNLTEVEPGVYVGKLKSVLTPGAYEIYARLIDFNGNIIEQKISDLIVAQKFTILEKDTDKPIENARILLYLYDQTTKVYELISPQSLSITNPSFSNPDGTVDLVLTPGKYKAKISALNYKSKTIEFEINQEGGYPLVELKRQPFNIINEITYYKNAFADTFNATANFVRVRSDSNRLFDLVTMGTIFIFVITTLFAFSAKTHIPVFYLPYFLIYKANLLLKKDKSSIFLGKVVEDTTKNPISRATVNLLDSKNNIITILKTNKLGEFYFPHVNLEDYKISVSKKGFKDIAPFIYKKEDKMIPLTIPITKNESKLEKEVDTLLIYLVDFVGLLFEFMLIIGIIAEIFLMSAFGFLRVAPFMTITVLNLLLLFLFLYKPRNLESN